MTRQPHLYDVMTGTVHSVQKPLFNPNDYRAGDSDIVCACCYAPLVRSSDEYLACPNGHGKLHVDAANVNGLN